MNPYIFKMVNPIINFKNYSNRGRTYLQNNEVKILNQMFFY